MSGNIVLVQEQEQLLLPMFPFCTLGWSTLTTYLITFALFAKNSNPFPHAHPFNRLLIPTTTSLMFC